MNRRTLAALCAALALLASGCVGWTLVKPGEAKLANGLVLHPDQPWSALKSGVTTDWTVHGTSLEALTIVSGLADGKPLARPASTRDKLPLFRSSMSATEVAEITVETMLRAGYGRVDLAGVRPATFAGRPGFRFDLDLADGRGLALSGFAAGAIVDGKLFLLVFRAPKLHYFASTQPAVDRLLATAELR